MVAEKKDKAMEQDFGPLIDSKIPEYRDLAVKQGKLAEAIENLLVLEKQTRNAYDVASTSKLACTIIDLCFEVQDWKLLNENLIVISKRRGQLKQAIQAAVQEAISFLDKFTPDQKSLKLELIETLRAITEGKIYVENERARLTRTLAKIKEDEGDIKKAAEILQELQVETYGAMEKLEKTDFILEQIRLCLDSNDFIRASIISKKINTKLFTGADFQSLKLRYYDLMIRYHSHDSNYIEISRSYRAIYDTPSIKEDETKWPTYLKLLILYLILSPHDPEQNDLLRGVTLDKNLEKLPKYKTLVEEFLKVEIMRWVKVEEVHRTELESLPVFTEGKRKKLWEDFKKRVIEHNIRVISTYYNQITLKRFALLLDLSIEETESNLSDLVVSKRVFARVNRPKGIVQFIRPKDPTEILNEWSENVNQLLSLVEKTSHLIQRENLIHSTLSKEADSI